MGSIPAKPMTLWGSSKAFGSPISPAMTEARATSMPGIVSSHLPLVLSSRAASSFSTSSISSRTKSSSSMSILTSKARVFEPKPTPTDFLAVAFSCSALARPHCPCEASLRMRSSVRTSVDST